MKKHSIAVSEEVYDYLKGMIDDEHVSNSDDSEERNANGEIVAHRPSFSEVISHLIEDRESEPRVWHITEERIGLLRYCLDSLLDAPDIEESPGPRHSIEMLRTMLAESEQCE
jgi:predicted CopG family antitoxin